MFQKKINPTTENKSSSIPFFFGFISGVVAGILFAPTEGAQTRKNLKKSIKSLVSTIEDSEIAEAVNAHPTVKMAEKNITRVINQTNSIKDTIDKKATSIIQSPIAKKIVHTTIADITPTINKKTGKKFITKKR